MIHVGFDEVGELEEPVDVFVRVSGAFVLDAIARVQDDAELEGVNAAASNGSVDVGLPAPEPRDLARSWALG